MEDSRVFKLRVALLLALTAVLVSIPSWVSAETTCPSMDPSFVASFQWRGNTRVEVRLDDSQAQFWIASRCVTLCQVKREPQRSLASLQPGRPGRDLVDMSCEPVQPGGLSGPATLYFKNSLASLPVANGPVLRFGTWLEGYRAMPVQVRHLHFADEIADPDEQTARNTAASARVQRKPAT